MLSLLAVSCTSPSASPRSDTPTEIVVGVPEASAEGAELGIGQFANLLSFESLTNNGADGRPVPRLAERWDWELDDRRLRIHLRPGVFLHDGRPFDATIAVELVRAAVTNPRRRSQFPALKDITSITADGSLQLVMDLSQPSAMLPDALTVPLDVGEGVVGTGPYRIVDATKASERRLEAFDRHYLGKPNIDKVFVRSLSTLRTSWASLLRGELDMVYDVPADAVQFIGNDDVQVVSVPRWYQYHVTFNSAKGPLRSPAVRRALNLAVDRAGLIARVLHGNGEPSTGPLYPKYWAYDDSVAPYQFDPAQAAALLDAAGYPMPRTSTSPDKPPARFRFTCLLPENFSVWERMGLEVQKNLFDVGIDMQFKVVPFEEFNNLVNMGLFDAALIDMISGPTPERAYIWWGSAREERVYNVFGYESAEAEQLFQLLHKSTNEAAVRAATRRLQRVFYDDPPALFLAWDSRARAVRRGFILPEGDRDPVLTLSQWSVGPASPPRLAATR